MAQEIPTYKIESLEFQTDQVYNALRRAATTGQDDDAFWAWAVYQALEVNLQSKVFPKVINGKQEIPRATPFDREFLQYAVMRRLPNHLRTAAMQRQQEGSTPKRVEVPVPDDELQALVTNPDSSYKAIVARASQLIDTGQIETIFMALDHIREIYNRQT